MAGALGRKRRRGKVDGVVRTEAMALRRGRGQAVLAVPALPKAERSVRPDQISVCGDEGPRSGGLWCQQVLAEG